MANYGQNGRFDIKKLGLDDISTQVIELLPIGGYTIESLTNFTVTDLNNLKSNLELAKFSLALKNLFNIDLTGIRALGFNEADDTEYRKFISNLQNDIDKSINNIIDYLSPGPVIDITGIDFNNVEINKSSTQNLIIKNKGDEELIITGYSGFGVGTGYKIIAPDGWDEISTDNPLKILPNESKSLSVIFSPTGVYSVSINVKFISNAKSGTNVASIRGFGISPIDTGVESILGKKKTNSIRILTLKNIREISNTTTDNTDIISPYFDNQETKHNVKLIGDIWQCYIPFGEDKQTQKLLLKDVVIGVGQGSFWFERCDDFLGGLRPVYQYFYELDKIKLVEEWSPIIREDYTSTILSGFTAISEKNTVELGKFNDFIQKIKQELDTSNSKWGKLNPNSPNQTSCESENISTENYLKNNMVAKNYSGKRDLRIYGGFSENLQKRSSNLINDTTVDLNSEINGNWVTRLDTAFVSKIAYGRLECLQPRTGCYVVDERPTNDYKILGSSTVTKMLNRAPLPEQIPNNPCYRGFKTRYITGYKWERRWEVQLNCIGGPYTDFVWIEDEQEFINKGNRYDIWENVEFAGTEIGFRTTCIPTDIPKEQEPYVDMSDFNGCYELHTTKIFKKYDDYLTSDQKDYIKGPMSLSTENYSGLGPGIKLNRRITRADCIDTPVKIYHPLHLGTDIIAGKDNIITKGLFNGNQSPLSYHTSSTQNINSKKYFYEIIDNQVNNLCKTASYFSVSYGNKNGSGSVYSGYEPDDSPTQAIYSQYRLLALESTEKEFKFYTNATESSGKQDFYVINFNRDSLTDRIDPGNFEINLKDISGLNNKVMSFIDNSNDLLESNFSNDYTYTYFDIVSGSLENGIENKGTGSAETNSEFTTYGRVYPSLGFIIFDAEKLDNELSFNTDRTKNVNTNNAYKLFTSISGAASIGMPIKVRSAKNLKTNHYFIRVSAGMSNYSNNPTMIDDISPENNMMKYNYFKYNPTTYITTVGLYNDAKELLAVAKLSKPILKTPSRDILIKIRLNW